MSNTVHALDFLESDEQAAKHPPACVIFGDESFLVQKCLKRLYQSWFGEEDALSARSFDGQTATWPDVIDEVATVSLFNQDGPRAAVVENAESFVKNYRDRIEDYLEHPAKSGVLVLIVNSWPANTRLYKRVHTKGFQLDCRKPKKSAKSNQVDLKRMERWIVSWSAEHHTIKVSASAAARVLDLVGPEFGLIDQELAKLALYADGKKTISPELVDQVVGGWRCQTVWEAVDAIMDGDASTGLQLLDRLLHAGEHPLALFGQLSWSIRRYGVAAEKFNQAEREGARVRLEQCIVQAGFREWNRTEVQNATRQLKRIGRKRALEIPRWLIETDLALKGSHSHISRARFALEQLCLKLATASAT